MTAPTTRDDTGDRPPEPEQIGRFVVERKLGAGGMGVVYLAFDPLLDRRVALKLLREDTIGKDGGERAQARLAREARAMARLQHPNVVTVHEVAIADGRVFVVMEYVAGGTLRQRLLAGATWTEVVQIYVAAGRGLAAAHAAGLVHRDFKPDNVLVDGERVLVSDFGIANVFGDDVETSGPGEPSRELAVTRTGTVVGTPLYMSPEQHLARPADARSDQFSFCAALYESLYGVAPFGDTDAMTIAMNAVDGKRTPLADERGVPASIRAVVERGLLPDPGDRFPTMSELLAALTPAPPRRRWPIVAIAAGALAVAVMAIVVIVVMTRRSDEPVVEPLARAPDCDCELFALQLPAHARVTGIRAATGGPTLVPARAPTGELAIPRGNYLVDYALDRTYSYGVVSAGAGARRVLALPDPEQRDGYRFVPGGDVPIGDAGGPVEERPLAIVHLAPYLVQIDESEPLTYANALERAREAGGRIPTAAEWEWAARVGAGDHMLARSWEWTSTVFAPYPYADDGRDDPFARAPTVEVRGGQSADCSVGPHEPCPTEIERDRPRPARRVAGVRAARAELRVVRTPVLVPVAHELLLHLESSGPPLAPRDLAALDRFLWEARDRALEFESDGSSLDCNVQKHLAAVGVDKRRIALVKNARPEGELLVRWHRDPAFVGEGLICIETDTSIEILDGLCFDENDAVLPRSSGILDSLAHSITSDVDGTRVRLEVRVDEAHRGDPVARSQRRAETVRRLLVGRGVAAARLDAVGTGLGTRPKVAPGEVDKNRLLGRQSALCEPLGDRLEAVLVR